MFHKRLVLKPICNQLAPVITARKSGSNKSTDGRRGRPRRDILSGPSARELECRHIVTGREFAAAAEDHLPSQLPRASRLMSFITGATLPVNGGAHLRVTSG
jgi:hypothetical protein